MYKKNSVCIVIPTKNEEKNLKIILPEIKKVKIIDEFIIIDAHSKDKTKEIAKKYGFSYHLDNKKGKGAALREAAKIVKSDIIVYIDADGSHDAKDITPMVEYLVDNKKDLVIGSRMRGGSDELNGTIGNAIRLFGTEIITITINKRFKVHLTDYENGFRAIRRKVILKLGLQENDFTIEQEMAMKALKKGYKVGEIPAHEYSRIHGTSNINIMKVAPRFVWTLIKYCFLTKK